MNSRLNNQIQALSSALKNDKNIFGMCLVGSSVSNKEYCDIDLLVVGENKDKIIKNIIKKFSTYKAYLNDDSVRIDGYLEKEVGIAVYEYKDLLENLNKYMNGIDINPIYKNWNIVGWLPECLLYDLNNMIIVYENENKITEIKNRVSIYPKKLKISIINNCDDKLNNLSKRIGKAEEIEQQIIDAEIKALNVRKYFAEKEMYFKGFKNIDKQLEELRD